MQLPQFVPKALTSDSDRYRFRKRRHDGSWSDELTHDIFERGRTVGVLPYDPALDSVVLIEQVRIGVHAGGGPLRPVEIVAGISEPGEAADDVARRELTEETGLTAIDLCPIGGVFLSPGGSSEHMTFFLARVDARGAGGHHGNRHEGEDILASRHDFAGAMTAISEGRINTAPAIIALQWLALNRDEVRRRWLPSAETSLESAPAGR